VYSQYGNVHGVGDAVSEETVHLGDTQQARRTVHMC